MPKVRAAMTPPGSLVEHNERDSSRIAVTEGQAGDITSEANNVPSWKQPALLELCFRARPQAV
jgi:hypothetical protein